MEKEHCMKKLALVVFVIFLIMMTGCTSKKIQIGFVTCNLNDSFQVSVKDAFVKYFSDKLEYEVIVQDAQEDVIKQQDMVKALLSQGVKAIAVVPVNTDAMAPIIEEVQQEKIPLIFVNRNPFGENDPPVNMYYIGSQEIVAGQFQGEEVARLRGSEPTGVCILLGILANEATEKRTQGAEEVFARYSNIKVLDKQTGNWQQDQGLAHTENWLTKYDSELNVIIGNNDGMALGAVKALKTVGRDDVLVLGIDAIPEALAAVRDGTMTATVLQDAVGQGHNSADYVYRALAGEKLAPVYWIPFKLITKENLADFM
jgi:inositol transport system substrate-binding protein